MELRGIIPPLTTPFTDNGEVYEEGLRRLVNFQIEKGSQGLFICGTYGSGPIMTQEERKRVHEIVADEARQRIAIVAHVGTASTQQSVELARHAESVGIHFVASISPFYFHHDDRAVVEYFRALVAAVRVPVYVYNNPSTTYVNVTPPLLRKLVEVGVVGIKDSGFDYISLTHLILALQDLPRFRFIVGTEGIALPAFMIGAKGCVSGLANAFPEIMVQLWDLFQAARYEEATKLQLRVNRAREILHIPGSTTAACYSVLKARGIDVGRPKPPILPIERDKEVAMLEEFKELGLL
ncbi:MAG: dihydrodipicolinate synthase family protein [Chloroflexi bacterium]|nr:dihydrodipicolinate synthase family protein [Chloroflexota bacterium]